MVLRFNPHAFTARDGTRVGALTREVGAGEKTLNGKDRVREGSTTMDVFKLVPTKLFNSGIKLLADEIVKIVRTEKNDAWPEELPEWSVRYLRYTGCARDGSDPDNAVAAKHAARKAEPVGAPAPTSARKEAIKVVTKKRKAEAAPLSKKEGKKKVA